MGEHLPVPWPLGHRQRHPAALEVGSKPAIGSERVPSEQQHPPASGVWDGCGREVQRAQFGDRLGREHEPRYLEPALLR